MNPIFELLQTPSSTVPPAAHKLVTTLILYHEDSVSVGIPAREMERYLRRHQSDARRCRITLVYGGTEAQDDGEL